MENSSKIFDRLPQALQESLLEVPPSPLRQWMGGHYYNAYALLRHASTFEPEITLAIILAAAAACLIDAAQEQQPVHLSYAEPIWRSLTEQQVPAQFLADPGHTDPNDGPSAIHTMGEIPPHTALGLSRTSALDHDTREYLMQKCLEDNSAISTALGWFSFDTELNSSHEIGSLARKFISQWNRTYPNDPDIAIMTIRGYLQSAVRIGAIGALDSIASMVSISLDSHEAAWAIAWHQATLNQEHEICAELAIRRATLHNTQGHADARDRWIYLYGFHEERRTERISHSFPVRRELLELMYKVEDPHLPAALALSIAARTNHLERVLRETLPFIEGPTVPLMRAIFSTKDTRSAIRVATQFGTAGLLVAMHLEQIALDFKEQHAETIIPTNVHPPPTAIFNDGDFHDDITLTNTNSQTTDSYAPALTSVSTDHQDSTSAADAAPDKGGDIAAANTHSKRRPVDTLPETLFSILPDRAEETRELNGEKSEKLPEVSDILLAAFLPDTPRVRADRILAKRIHDDILRDRSLLRAFEERIVLLPISGWKIAEIFASHDDPHTAKTWMRQIAENTQDSPLRAERLRLLAKHTALQCQNLSEAVEYLVASLEASPSNADALSLIDTIYTRTLREKDLIFFYEAALANQHAADVDPALVEQWTDRMTQLRQHVQA